LKNHPLPKVRIEIKCEWCGEPFKAHPNSKRRFCSKSCATKWRNSIYGNPMKNPNTIEKTRRTKKEYYAQFTAEELKKMQPWRRVIGKVNAHYVTKWAQTHGKEISERLKKYYQQHPEKHPNSLLRRDRMTRIEKVVAKILESLKLPYLWNSYIKIGDTWKFPDFRIVNTNILIECNGSYWHTPEKDEERKRLFEKHGYEVIMLEEPLIKLGEKAVIERLLSYPSFQMVLNQYMTYTLKTPTISS